jgi:hypothetical protein
MASQSKILKLPAPSDSDESLDTTLCDLRFRALLPDDDWGRLPLATWRRFSKRLADGKTAIYVGEVVEVQFSRIGWWVAQLARLIGGPLPTCGDTNVPSIVTVTEDAATGGQSGPVSTRAGTVFHRSFTHRSASLDRRVWRSMSGSASAWRCGCLSMAKPCCFAAPVTLCRLGV